MEERRKRTLSLQYRAPDARLPAGILAQTLCLLIGHIDVVEATKEGCQDDHEDEHEPGGQVRRI